MANYTSDALYIIIYHMYNVHVHTCTCSNNYYTCVVGTSTTPQVSAAISGHTSTSASTTGGKRIFPLYSDTRMSRCHTCAVDYYQQLSLS